MKRVHLICLLLPFLCVCADGQTLPVIPKSSPDKTTGRNLTTDQLASVLLYAPVGSFARSHLAGLGLNYAISPSRYRIYVFKKYIGFTANAGIDYYLGKKTDVADHNFTYGGYGYAYIQAGIITGIAKNAAISLTAGPSIGLYKGNTELGWNAAMIASWGVSNTRMVIGPGITVKKQKETDALWAIAFRVSYRL